MQESLPGATMAPINEQASISKSTVSTPSKASVGIEVTAADFNGTTFDGAPLVPVGISREVFGDLLARDVISINVGRDTDYARWNVETPEGVKVVGPGDFIHIDSNGHITDISFSPENVQ